MDQKQQHDCENRRDIGGGRGTRSHNGCAEYQQAEDFHACVEHQTLRCHSVEGAIGIAGFATGHGTFGLHIDTNRGCLHGIAHATMPALAKCLSISLVPIQPPIRPITMPTTANSTVAVGENNWAMLAE